jgi:hypothetical protein
MLSRTQDDDLPQLAYLPNAIADMAKRVKEPIQSLYSKRMGSLACYPLPPVPRRPGGYVVRQEGYYSRQELSVPRSDVQEHRPDGQMLTVSNLCRSEAGDNMGGVFPLFLREIRGVQAL